jgi:hypothetical protein
MKQPTPKLDALRAMREARFAENEKRNAERAKAEHAANIETPKRKGKGKTK